MKTRSGRRASQREEELAPFIALLLERGARSYLEIGAREGDTFHRVMRALPPGSRGVAVDLPGGRWGGDTKKHLQAAVLDLKRYDAHVLLGSSADPEIIARVRELGPYDACLIDGDHTIAAVTNDWLVYKQMSSLVAFHDVAGRGVRQKRTGDPVEVYKLWHSIKASGVYRTQEFVAPGDPRMGIGVVLGFRERQS